MKKYSFVLTVVLIILCVSGCTLAKLEEEKLQDLEYEIVSEAQQPDAIQMLIQDNKASQMKMSYVDQGKEYILIGYGEQDTSGYSVEIIEVYETENAVYVDTNLLGPTSNEEIMDTATYPYLVICIEETEKPIIYD